MIKRSEYVLSEDEYEKINNAVYNVYNDIIFLANEIFNGKYERREIFANMNAIAKKLEESNDMFSNKM